jgi:hypothetical protein
VREGDATPPNSKLPDTLEECIAGEDFARRGLVRLIQVTDYLAHLVDGRTTGVLATVNRETYLRVLGLATTVKAALQWFVLDPARRPRFVVEAEKYLAEGPTAEWIRPPAVVPDDECQSIRAGPVVGRKGGRGSAGRLYSLSELKRNLVELLEPFTQDDLHRHQAALHDPEHPKPKEGWILGRAIGDVIYFALVDGVCSDMLREQRFEWPPWEQVRASLDLVVESALDRADIGEPADTRAARLDELAEELIRGALVALGVRVEKDLFRERRAR